MLGPDAVRFGQNLAPAVLAAGLAGDHGQLVRWKRGVVVGVDAGHDEVRLVSAFGRGCA